MQVRSECPGVTLLPPHDSRGNAPATPAQAETFPRRGDILLFKRHC